MVGTVGNPGFSQSSVFEDPTDILVFTVRDVRFGVPAVLLDHVIRMVAITPVDDPPRGIVGIINYHGDVLPVFSFRRYLSLDEKPPDIQDFLIIVREERHMAIVRNISGHIVKDKIISPENLSRDERHMGIYPSDDVF